MQQELLVRRRRAVGCVLDHGPRRRDAAAVAGGGLRRGARFRRRGRRAADVAPAAHFFTDVVFAGVVVFLVIWLTHGLLYRWRATRLSDAAVEHALERVGTPGYDAVMWIAARLRGSAPKS